MDSVLVYQNDRWSLKSFLGSTGGNVGMLFALFAIPAFGLMGMGLDYSSAVAARSNVQNIADTAEE